MAPNESRNNGFPPSELKDWLYRNVATVLLTVTIALSSIIWGQLVSTMEQMSADIRELTAKINELVVNQATQKRTIEDNSHDIQELEKTLKRNQKRWESQWRDKAQNQNE